MAGNERDAGQDAPAELASLSPPEALSKILAVLDADTGTLHRLRADGLLHLEQHSGPIPDALLPVIGRIPVGKGMAGWLPSGPSPYRSAICRPMLVALLAQGRARRACAVRSACL